MNIVEDLTQGTKVLWDNALTMTQLDVSGFWMILLSPYFMLFKIPPFWCAGVLGFVFGLVLFEPVVSQDTKLDTTNLPFYSLVVYALVAVLVAAFAFYLRRNRT